jgi:hypothetical protein
MKKAAADTPASVGNEADITVVLETPGFQKSFHSWNMWKDCSYTGPLQSNKGGREFRSEIKAVVTTIVVKGLFLLTQ